MRKMFTGILLIVSVYSGMAQTRDDSLSYTRYDTSKFSLAGTWILQAAQVIHPDGKQETDAAFGPDAKGVLMVDNEGQYSLQIFRPDRPKFASGDKKRGTPREYEAALLGISTHIGQIIIDTVTQTLQFKIDYAAYPNWEHTIQTRKFKLSGDELYYQVPANAGGGTIAVSIWRRVKAVN